MKVKQVFGRIGALALGALVGTALHSESPSLVDAGKGRVEITRGTGLESDGAVVPRPALDAVIEASGSDQWALFLRYLATADMAEILELLDGDAAPEGKLSCHREAVTARGIELNPAAMVSLVRRSPRYPFGLVKESVLREIYRLWSAIDADSAAQYCAVESDDVQAELIKALMESDPNRAFGYCEEWLSDSPMFATLREAILGKLAANDLPGALDAALAISSPGERREALAAVVAKWSETDPAAAFDWARDSISEDSEKFRAMAEAVKMLAAKEPFLAIKKASILPASRQRSGLFVELIRAWSAHDSAAALAWVQQQPASSLRNSLALAFTEQLDCEPREPRTPRDGAITGLEPVRKWIERCCGDNSFYRRKCNYCEGILQALQR